MISTFFPPFFAGGNCPYFSSNFTEFQWIDESGHQKPIVLPIFFRREGEKTKKIRALKKRGQHFPTERNEHLESYGYKCFHTIPPKFPPFFAQKKSLRAAEGEKSYRFGILSPGLFVSNLPANPGTAAQGLDLGKLRLGQAHLQRLGARGLFAWSPLPALPFCLSRHFLHIAA